MRVVVRRHDRDPCLLIYRSAWAKLWRAEQHLMELTQCLDGVAQLAAPRSVREADDLFCVCFDVPRFPVKASLIIGDVLTNSRAALDHLVDATVRNNGEVPSRINRFPIHRDDETFLRSIHRDLLGSPPEFITMIQRECSGKRRWLNQLNTLVNQDKHASLVPVGHVSQVKGLSVYRNNELMASYSGYLAVADDKLVSLRLRRPFDSIEMEEVDLRWTLSNEPYYEYADLIVEVRTLINVARSILFAAQDLLFDYRPLYE